ncbi:hypothetical protein FNV43_RR11880 [Rhamnella rubrinervis]|uniref:Uncharacterized protein n=1 Tax=Rhamnella rubrinervis TaxID=2594499 RepID=A0A8K0H765_9ROSA|nr:hypothetical protein FNV43_RR11880 [Rhamnella rubrinervis]
MVKVHLLKVVVKMSEANRGKAESVKDAGEEPCRGQRPNKPPVRSGERPVVIPKRGGVMRRIISGGSPPNPSSSS